MFASRRVPVIVFSGHFETDEQFIYAVCDPPTVAAHGATKEEAVNRVLDAIMLYLRTLDARGEFEEAIRAGLFKIRLEKDQEASTPRIEASASRFRLPIGELVTA